MTRSSHRALLGLAATGMLVAALVLGGCGSKGGLDLPPGAAVPPPPPAGDPGQAYIGPDGRPVAAPAKTSPIDFLID